MPRLLSPQNDHAPSFFRSPFGRGDALRSLQASPPHDPVGSDLRVAGLLFTLLLGVAGLALAAGWNSPALTADEPREAAQGLAVLFPDSGEAPALYPRLVALVASIGGWPPTPVARLISAAFWLASFPAVAGLLRRLGLTPSARLLALTPLLTCGPLLLHARAFLPDTAALAAGLWFVIAVVHGVEDRSFGWIALANVTGVAAASLQPAALLLAFIPVIGIAGLLLWPERPRARYHFGNLHDFWVLLTCIAAAITFPATLLAFRLPAVHATRPDGSSLANLLHAFPHASLVLIGLALVLTTPARRGAALMGVALAFCASMIEQLVSDSTLALRCALWAASAGLTLSGMFAAGKSRWLAWSVFSLFHFSQIAGCFGIFFPPPQVDRGGESGMVQLLRDATAPEEELVVAGENPSSALPFFAGRRARLVSWRKDSGVSAQNRPTALAPLLLVEKHPEPDRAALDRLTQNLGLDSRPFATDGFRTLYVSSARRAHLRVQLFNLTYPDILFAEPAEISASAQPEPVAALMSTRVFAGMDPMPVRYQVPARLRSHRLANGQSVFDARAPSRLWFASPAGVTHLRAEFGIPDAGFPPATAPVGSVEFAIIEHRVDGTEQTLFARLLDPSARPADRELQRVELPLAPAPGAEIIFETRPGPTADAGGDLAYWRTIQLR